MSRKTLEIVALSVVLAAGSSPAWANPLEDYVRKPDDSFHWQVVERKDQDGLEVTTLDLTSQTWRDMRWTHKFYIGRPREVRHPSIAFLRVAGGISSNDLPTARLLAERSGALVAGLSNVPNQPILDGRKEDQIIAYTFEQYAKTGDETWPALLPMVKSVVRAMDAVQAWAAAEHLPKVEKFVIWGASKRGWTTWLTAAVDPRVVGIAPMVFDMLNIPAQKAYGRQSEQIHDYTDLNLVEKLDTPPMTKLMSFVDPYSYRARYTMPKLILIGTNDRYWTVDSLRHYWNELPEPKLVYQAPNTGHSAGGTAAATQTLAAFFQMIADNQTLPKMKWQVSGTNSALIAVQCDRPAKSALLWTAFSPTRDFRDAKWSSRPLPMNAGNTQVTGKVETPVTGFAACLVELTFTTNSGTDYQLSTQVQVTPDN